MFIKHVDICVKGMFHSKMKIKATHPQVVPNLYEFLSSAKTKII